jgi:predicted MPP superfamily phosphohydrolase
VAVLALGFLIFYNFGIFARVPDGTHLTLRSALLEAPFRWWFVGSTLSFMVAMIFAAIRALLDRIANLRASKPALGDGLRASADAPASLSRRAWFERTADLAAAVPFVAAGYGLLVERVDLEVVHTRVVLSRLPKAFHGFRIVQLSDFHIGPFMSYERLRKWAAVANSHKPDLIVLTGDFVTWDASTQGAAVRALADLSAPFGVFGCLGNHEAWTETEESITALFAAHNVRILRQERAFVWSGGDLLNLLGVDYQSKRRVRHGPHGERIVHAFLERIENLVASDTVNILLSHNPNTFDRAAELGIDLSLAGHTHGGQVTLEYVSPYLSPSRLITPYVQGWFHKGSSSLYVNRGLGTIGVPIRLGAPPELTVFELVRG